MPYNPSGGHSQSKTHSITQQNDIKRTAGGGGGICAGGACTRDHTQRSTRQPISSKTAVRRTDVLISIGRRF